MAKVNIKQIIEDSFVGIVESLTDITAKNIPVRRGLDYEDNLGKWQIIVIAEYSPAYPNAPLYDITVNLIAMMHNEDDLSGDNTSEIVGIIRDGMNALTISEINAELTTIKCVAGSPFSESNPSVFEPPENYRCESVAYTLKAQEQAG
jgi:hypothetical protein